MRSRQSRTVPVSSKWSPCEKGGLPETWAEATWRPRHRLSDEATSQGGLGPPKLERQEESSSGASEGARPWGHPDVRAWPPDQGLSCCLSPSVVLWCSAPRTQVQGYPRLPPQYFGGGWGYGQWGGHKTPTQNSSSKWLSGAPARRSGHSPDPLGAQVVTELGEGAPPLMASPSLRPAPQLLPYLTDSPCQSRPENCSLRGLG